MIEAIQTYYGQDKNTCAHCGGRKINYGKTRYGAQRTYCKVCKKASVVAYRHKAYEGYVNAVLVRLLKEGYGIRSIARLLKIAINTVLTRIRSIARNIQPPLLRLHKEYEIDELCTYIGNKEHKIWIAGAWERESKRIVRFTIGTRTNKTLQKVVQDILVSQPVKIGTDKLQNYFSLIPAAIHSTVKRVLQHLERMHLTLRTHIKRLNRKTLAFSKNKLMLEAVLKIYLWY